MLSTFSTFAKVLFQYKSPRAEGAKLTPRQGTPMRVHKRPPELSLSGLRAAAPPRVEARLGPAAPTIHFTSITIITTITTTITNAITNTTITTILIIPIIHIDSY